MVWNKKTKKLIPDELQRIDKFFRSQAEDLNLIRIHGFITAIASFPDVFTPSEWIPILIDEAKFTNEKEVRMVLEGLMSLYFQVEDNFKYQDEFKFILSISDPEMDYEKATYDQIREWCSGYCLALIWNEDEWLHEEDEFITKACTTFFMLSDILRPNTDYQGDIKWSEEDKYNLITDLPQLVKAIQLYWLEEREELYEDPDFTVDDLANIKKNEPCPCGSGKKYKQCCMLEVAEAILH